MPSISSYDIISVAAPEPKIFVCILASAADAAVNPNGIKSVSANSLIKFSLKVILFLIMDQ